MVICVLEEAAASILHPEDEDREFSETLVKIYQTAQLRIPQQNGLKSFEYVPLFAY
jgi:hypothetical protein